MGAVKALRRISLSVIGFTVPYSYYHFLTQYIYEIAVCRGESMEPTLYEGDIVIVEKRNPYLVKKRDIVIIRSPADPNKLLCKRVTHLPYEWVSSENYNGKIHKGMVWLEGDNLERSMDSRNYGPFPKSLIVGKPVLKIWPKFKSLTPDVTWET